MFGWFSTNSRLRRELAAEKAKNKKLAEQLETCQLQSWIRRQRPAAHVIYRCPSTLPAADATEQIRRIG